MAQVVCPHGMLGHMGCWLSFHLEAMISIWRVSQQMGDLCFSMCLSTSQIYKEEPRTVSSGGKGGRCLVVRMSLMRHSSTTSKYLNLTPSSGS